MIPSKDLMLGNCVYMISKQKHYIIDRGQDIDSSDDFNPIKATNDLLIKLGAVRIEGWDGMIFYRFTEGNNSTDLEECVDGYENDQGLKIKYLHQVQNYVYFSIGKELILNLPQ